MNKRVQEASEMKRGPMLTALLIGAFVAFLNENLLANALPDYLCIHVLEECDRSNQAKGRSCIHCDVNRRFRLRRLRLQPNKCLSRARRLRIDCNSDDGSIRHNNIAAVLCRMC